MTLIGAFAGFVTTALIVVIGVDYFGLPLIENSADPDTRFNTLVGIGAGLMAIIAATGGGKQFRGRWGRLLQTISLGALVGVVAGAAVGYSAGSMTGMTKGGAVGVVVGIAVGLLLGAVAGAAVGAAFPTDSDTEAATRADDWNPTPRV